MTLLDAVPYAIAGAVMLGAGGYYMHCESVKKDREQFITQLKADAEAQRKGIATRIERDEKAKEIADAQVLKDRAALRRTISRLRNDARSGPSLVPAAASCPGKPDTATFDRTELDRALRNFTEGVSVLIGEGESAAIELDNARRWHRDVLEH